MEKYSCDWWFIRKTLTREVGFVPASIFEDSNLEAEADESETEIEAEISHLAVSEDETLIAYGDFDASAETEVHQTISVSSGEQVSFTLYSLT